MDGAASLSIGIGDSERVLVFRHGTLVLFLTVLRYNDWTAEILGTDPDGSIQFRSNIVRGEDFKIGFASSINFDGYSPNDSRRGRFRFKGPPHIDFWRQARCPGNKYPGPHPQAKNKKW